MKKKRLLILAVIIIFAFILLIPTKSTCHFPGESCTTAPNANGKVLTYFENIPVGIFLIESLTKTDTGIKYSSDYDSQIIEDKKLIPLKQTTLTMGLADNNDPEKIISLSETEIAEINAEAGKTVEKEIELSIESEPFKNLRVYVFPFDINREDCSDKELELGESSENDASKWISFSVTSTDEDHKEGKAKILVRADVPADTEPKTYWASINFAGNSNPNKITLNSTITVPVFVTVGGNEPSEQCVAER